VFEDSSETLYASTKLHFLTSQIIAILKLKIVVGGGGGGGGRRRRRSGVVAPGVIVQRAAKSIFLIFDAQQISNY